MVRRDSSIQHQMNETVREQRNTIQYTPPSEREERKKHSTPNLKRKNGTLAAAIALLVLVLLCVHVCENVLNQSQRKQSDSRKHRCAQNALDFSGLICDAKFSCHVRVRTTVPVMVVMVVVMEARCSGDITNDDDDDDDGVSFAHLQTSARVTNDTKGKEYLYVKENENISLRTQGDGEFSNFMCFFSHASMCVRAVCAHEMIRRICYLIIFGNWRFLLLYMHYLVC